MKTLKNSSLSGNKLQSREIEHIQDLDSPIPLSIVYLLPQGERTMSVQSNKDNSMWESILASTDINKK
jgi:hypothetical protein